ncbi:hypothetical protein SMD22_02110 (plasmid) [Brevibacillus halotolerans]|nr:hypothetical protein SMD22_02110 [Brevibacillus halotolerans]
MSLNTKFNTWGEVLEYLKRYEEPKCLTVNFLNEENQYEIWIGNQPYHNYEQLIELEQKEKEELRKTNKQLREELECYANQRRFPELDLLIMKKRM